MFFLFICVSISGLQIRSSIPLRMTNWSRRFNHCNITDTTTSITTMGTIFEVLMMGWVFMSTLSWCYLPYGKGNWGSKKVRKLPLVPWCAEKNLALPKERCGFPDSSVGKESACNAGDPSLIPGSGRSPGEGKGCPLQYSGLENSMDCMVHEFAKSWTRQSDFHIQGKMWSLPWISER